MQAAFNGGLDIHTATAAQVFGVAPDQVTPLQRRNAKAVNFGIVYGISAFSLSQDIGVNVAERLLGMGAAKIIGLSRSGRPDPAFDEVYPISKLEELLPQTQTLIMALPGTAETHHILNRERIALLPRDAYVINVGRGSAVDQEALADALNAGLLAGAALDVFVPEPLPEDHFLWDTKNLILTPHVSGNLTLGYTCDLNVQMFCEDLANYAEGRPLNGLVDRKLGY